MTADAQQIEETAIGHVDAGHEGDHGDHPTQAQYWLIAFVLAVVTAIEVAIPAIEFLDGPPGILLLFALSAVKFATVVALFMHLKFERPLHRMLFLIGLGGALAMFVVVLLTFRAL